MKIVVINGSPHKNGISMQLFNHVIKDIQADIKVYSAYHDKIAACIDCKYCFTHFNECVIKDDFQAMVKDMDDADVVALVSPIHFSTYSAKLLQAISRLQTVFAVKYEFKKPLPFKDKKGLSIITGGNNYPTQFDSFKPIDHVIFRHINAHEVETLHVKKTDRLSMEEILEEYAEEISSIRKFLGV
ncbi:flavodoxin family protein [Mycoplasma sp. P36-A1]|uniref:flavodoxin family protein n=1 Tax=Mycoplasma sp. P36-A1 TaxID=3252900 RepID=UPI003C2CC1E1